MAKYMVLYSSSQPASEQMANASMEEMQASMANWTKWRDDASENFEIDFGLPLETVGRVTSQGISNETSQISGYAIIDGESKDAVLELIKTHPHMNRPDASIEVLEMLSMPGL